ncbi:hypothetical protein [Synechococcus elongatus]|uniref:Uncharacterized protein n=2 Tax=Synechococcus elongatus TaxID=32046 RepID=Q31NN6_SYNE7|nr:hypothetical protein [Synechococcus elongatus]ABB57333.1 conserved hypothetical protein [Synechococcus elongatus PCC 7942 = FACHB-805]AJD58156.1 hypothetical protein M744_10110 [Synechococcus elongatus UTEX 2973]MBD2587740.1 hypothetical protein [Synechococcus elongatus FACHB-242]MBD2688481.1 hypothetical protein [Synechococcus elongatus FACHB-1061]MBD2707552.1 hypothetical protein [Synechococcus elongatus PCC 7942 = FACHB-805]
MGKAKLQRLLGELEAVQLSDRQNAAAIYTVATVAVQKLKEQAVAPPVPALPEAAPVDFSAFKQQFVDHKACRQWLKGQGVQFAKTPSWEDLYQSWRYLLAVQPALTTTLQTHPLPASAKLTIAPHTLLESLD